MKNKIDSVDFSNLPFGKIFTDHMIVVKYSDKKWGEASLVPYGPLDILPSISSLHYGQSVFEGMKAFFTKDSHITIFRPEAHSKRLNLSLARLDMPSLPENILVESVEKLVLTDVEWLKRAGQLYLRPFVFAIDPYLGVKSSEEYMFAVLACPVGPYYSKPLNLKVETKYSRSSSGGVGSAKAAGNYAASLYPTKLAQEAGFDQIIWTDSSTHTYVEESGTMNIMVIKDGVLITPELGDTILSGITRDSVLTLAREGGVKVEERKLKVVELMDGIRKGEITEVFGTGTAATVIRVASVTDGTEKHDLPDLGSASFARKFNDELNDIKKGNAPDTHGWVHLISEKV